MNRTFYAGLGLISLMITLTILLPWLSQSSMSPSWLSHAPYETALDIALQPPSGNHLLGTDSLGRDVLIRTIYAGRVSLMIGLFATAIALLIGVPLGVIAGYFGSFWDATIARLLEALLCIPNLLIVLILAHAPPGFLAAMDDVTRLSVLLGLTGWMPTARYVRSEVLKIKVMPWVAAGQSAGTPTHRLVMSQVLPATLTTILVTAAFSVGSAIGLEAALSFLGLGIDPPTPSWGEQLSEARQFLRQAGWLAWPPGVALFLTILSSHWIGEGLRKGLNKT